MTKRGKFSMKKYFYLAALTILLTLVLILTGCSNDSGVPDEETLDNTATISGQVMLPSENASTITALIDTFINSALASTFSGETPFKNTSINIINYQTGEQIATATTDNNGEYTVTGIPEGIDIIVVATDGNVRMSGIISDVGIQSTINGDINVTTTLVAESLAANSDEIVDVTTDSLNTTLIETEQYILNNHTNNNGEVQLDLSIGGNIINDQIGDGVADSAIKSNISNNFGTVINFSDSDLENVIRNTINKEDGSIYTSEVEQITELDGANSNIESLEGIENLVNLEVLDLGLENVDGEWVNSNNISDLTQLSQLTDLRELILFSNNISDISSLSGLTNLTRLSLDYNNISNISPLSGLDNLIRLDLAHNNISDISDLPALTVLDSLDISYNNVVDITVLENLASITWLGLRGNQIESIAPLSDLTTLSSLYLSENPITDYSPVIRIFDQIGNKDFDIIGFTDPADGQIYITNLAGVKTKITNDEHDHFMHPRWSPDKSKIAFVSDKDGDEEIYVMDSDGTNIQQITNNSCYDLKPSWSPDGNQLAFNSNRSDPDNIDAMEIYIMDTDGSNLEQITDNNYYDSIPLWSPDGNKLIFSSEQDSAADVQYEEDIFAVDVNTLEVEQLTQNDYQEGRAVWSPDGSRITFQMAANEQGSNENLNIYIMDADGSNIVSVTDNNDYEWAWGWSPDGSKVIFTRGYYNDNGITSIYTVNADGTDITKIYDGAFPQWFH